MNLDKHTKELQELTGLMESTRNRLYSCALAAYIEGEWRDPYGCWGNYIDDALAHRISRKELHLIRVGMPILARLKENPLVRNGMEINHATFGMGRSSKFQDILPVVSGLNLDREQGAKKFEEYVWAAATLKRQALRDWLAVKSRPLNKRPTLKISQSKDGVIFRVACTPMQAEDIRRALAHLTRL